MPIASTVTSRGTITDLSEIWVQTLTSTMWRTARFCLAMSRKDVRESVSGKNRITGFAYTIPMAQDLRRRATRCRVASPTVGSFLQSIAILIVC